MGELSITLKIADRPYKMTVKRKDEEGFRKAASLINEKMKAYATAYSYKDKQDLLTMVSLEYVIKFLNFEDKTVIEDNTIEEKLKDINKVLDEFLKNA